MKRSWLWVGRLCVGPTGSRRLRLAAGWLLCLAATAVGPQLRAQGVVAPPAIRANGVASDAGVFRYLTSAPVSITLSAGPEAAEIYYTTDGSDPDPGLAFTLRYSLTGPFEVVPPAVVRAVVETATFDYSAVSEARLLFVASYRVIDGTEGGGGFSISPAAPDYSFGSTVTLTATNLPGWQFLRWEGGLTGTNPVSPLTIDGERVVRAVFGTTIQTSVNSVAGQPGGAVALEPAGGPYAYGSLVRLMALPSLGRAFTGWTNNPAWTNQQLLTVAVTNANPAYRALFNTLSAASGSNTVTLKVIGSGAAVRVPEAPRAVYRAGSTVEVRPTPDPGWVFDGWSGDAVGAANPLHLEVNTNKIVTARFVRRLPGEPVIEGLDLAEYFWDVAPLEGQGTRLALSGGDTWLPEPRELDVSGLAPGLHQLGLRVRDDQRRWSPILWQALMVEPGQELLSGVAEWPDAAAKKWLVAAEYFWDGDPGAGRGVAVPVIPGETLVTVEPGGPAVDVAGLAPGLHTLGFRVKDGTGRWGEVGWSRLVVEPGQELLSGVAEWPEVAASKMLVAAEYFWDADPGPGLGVALAIEPGETLAASPLREVGTESLTTGWHQFGFRVRDGTGRWSSTT